MNQQVVLTAVIAAIGTGLPSLLLFYFKDRKRNDVEVEVAEGTKQSVIDRSSISAVEAQAAFVQQAFQSERDSMGRQIANLNERLIQAEARQLQAETRQVEAENIAARQREELRRVQTEMERLRGEVDHLNTALQSAMQRLAEAMGAESERLHVESDRLRDEPGPATE